MSDDVVSPDPSKMRRPRKKSARADAVDVPKVAKSTGKSTRKSGTRKRATSARSTQEKNVGGRPPKIPTAEQCKLVAMMTSMATFSQEAMAARLGISVPTFRKYREQGYFAEAIAKGQADGLMVSSGALFKAMREGNMTAVIWYEKTRHGMTEKVHQIVSDPQGNALPAGAPSTHVSVGIFLPPNGRDVAPEGLEVPAQFQILPPNGREASA